MSTQQRDGSAFQALARHCGLVFDARECRDKPFAKGELKCLDRGAASGSETAELYGKVPAKAAPRPHRGLGEKDCKHHESDPDPDENCERSVEKVNNVVGHDVVVIDMRGDREVDRGQEAKRAYPRLRNDEGASQQQGCKYHCHRDEVQGIGQKVELRHVYRSRGDKNGCRKSQRDLLRLLHRGKEGAHDARNDDRNRTARPGRCEPKGRRNCDSQCSSNSGQSRRHRVRPKPASRTRPCHARPSIQGDLSFAKLHTGAGDGSLICRAQERRDNLDVFAGRVFGVGD